MASCAEQAKCEHRTGAQFGCPVCVSRVRGRFPEFPLQVTEDKRTKPGPVSVPWEVAERAWAAYSQAYGREQSVERLAERGGFSWGEMDMFFPGWREATDTWKQLEAERDALRAQLDAVGTEVQRASEEDAAERDNLRSQVKELQAALELAHVGLKERAAAERALSEVRRILGAGEVESTEAAAMRVAAKAGLRVPGTTALDNGWGARPRVLRAEVLNNFAVEENPAGALERCQHKHPALAEDLAELAGELAQPERELEGPLSAEDEALVNAAVARLNLVKVVDPDAALRSRLAPTPTPDVPPLAPTSTESQDVDWQAMQVVLRANAPTQASLRHPPQPPQHPDDSEGTAS